MAVTLSPPAAAPEPAAPDVVAQEPSALLTCLVTLDEPFASWLKARAEAHGLSVEAQAAALLRLYWAQHDAWRHEQASAATRPAGER